MPKLTKEYLDTLSPEHKKNIILHEYIKCKFDIKYCIETYFTVMKGVNRVPFVLFPHQIETLKAYETYNNNITLKARQLGFTTFTAAWTAHKVMFKNNYKVILVSKTKTDSKIFLKEIKDTLDNARNDYPWLVPDYAEGYNNKESFTLVTGSLVKAEAATDEAARGTSGASLLICDEVASIDRRSPEKMSEIWASASPSLATTQGKAIMISTPRGQSGWYYNTYVNAKSMGFHIIDARWTDHPIYNLGTYQWIWENEEQTQGHLKFHSEEWPETIFDKDAGSYIKVDKDQYPFILDGKIRSPWYDMESAKLGPRRTACELDCVFIGTGGEVFDGDMLLEMRVNMEKQAFTNPFENLKGIWKSYREYKAPIKGHKYILSADVATGDGSDYSAFTVIDITALEIVATYKDQLLTTTYAIPIIKVGRRYLNAHVIVENAGGGETTLQQLKMKNYPHIYYSVLNKKDPSTGIKKRKIGLWPSENVRMQGGDRLEEVIRMKQLLIPDEYLVTEFYTWIWDKDGRRRHAPEKNDDIIMALQHGMWYYFYVYKRAQKNLKNFKEQFEVRQNGKSVQVKLEEESLDSTELESDESIHRSTFVTDKTQYVIMPNAAASISGNLDKMIDARIMSSNELAKRQDNLVYARENGKSGRRTYI